MPRTRQRTLRRSIALLAVAATALVFAVRLFDVQVVQAGELNAEADGKRAVPVVIPSLRGDIVDRNGEILGTTDERYDVQLSPKNARLKGGKFYRLVDGSSNETVLVTAEEAFAEIGAITGQTAEEIAKIVDDALADDPKSDFAYVKRFVDLTTLNKLKALRIPWLTFASQFNRIYPNGAVGGNLVGFVGMDGEPQAGIEYSQNECLVGIDGEESYERSADGVRLPGSVVVTQQAENGGVLKLAIDLDLQWQAQQAINEQVQRVAAEWGYLVIMDTRTGELVAVADDGSVDPNNVDGSDASKREARSFIRPYEPGSTFKVITASALLNEGLATPNTEQYTPYSWEPEPDVRFADALVHPDMRWTLTGIVVNSSNVGISKLGSRMSAETRYDYLKKFGVGVATEAGMPLEDAGILRSPDEWDRQSNYNIMFGQGVSSTIIQTAGIFQTIANGGVRIPASLALSCTAADGSVTTFEHGEPVRAVSEDTAASMMQILEAVANEGWNSQYVQIPGYRVAGKTGTAEQVGDDGRYRSDYVNTFAGIFPADDPRYVVVASIAFPAAGDGGVAAAQAFRAAAEATIRTFHISPSTGAYQPLPLEY